MVVNILCVWFFLTFPMVREVNKHLKNSENDWLRYRFMFQVILIWKAFWGVPIYYYLLIRDSFKKNKNK